MNDLRNTPINEIHTLAQMTNQSDISHFIIAAYVIAAVILLWMWAKSTRMLKKSEDTLKSLEKKP